MRTADGAEVVDGLRVWDNDLDTGTVVINDRYRAHDETNQNTGTVEWWFYMQKDKGGSPRLTSESRTVTRWNGKAA